MPPALRLVGCRAAGLPPGRAAPGPASRPGSRRRVAQRTRPGHERRPHMCRVARDQDRPAAPAVGQQRPEGVDLVPDDAGLVGPHPRPEQPPGRRLVFQRLVGLVRKAVAGTSSAGSTGPFRIPSGTIVVGRTESQNCAPVRMSSVTPSCGSGMIGLVPLFRSSIGVKQASRLLPSMFIAQKPHTPSGQACGTTRSGLSGR